MNGMMRQFDKNIEFDSVRNMKPKYEAALREYFEASNANPETLLLYIGRAWLEYESEWINQRDILATERSDRAKARLHGFLNVLKEFNL